MKQNNINATRLTLNQLLIYRAPPVEHRVSHGPFGSTKKAERRREHKILAPGQGLNLRRPRL